MNYLHRISNIFGNEKTIRLLYFAIFYNFLYLTLDLAKYDKIPLNVISIFLISGISLLAAFHARLELCAQHHIVSRGATGSLKFSNL